MCTQSVGLLAGVLEGAGISTVCVALVRSVAERVRPPRALAVPFPFGSALDRAGDPPRQRAVMRRAFDLLQCDGPGPILKDLPTD
ncbi:MAG TPA: hypothetical protein VNF92_11785 [Gemmatimonadaceae bacterium]|nr:hypothetical protein [Gemmatimonadaceae bacterium]